MGLEWSRAWNYFCPGQLGDVKSPRNDKDAY